MTCAKLMTFACVGSFFGALGVVHADCRLINYTQYVLTLSSGDTVKSGNAITIPDGKLTARAENPRRPGIGVRLELSCTSGMQVEVSGPTPTVSVRADRALRAPTRHVAKSSPSSDEILPLGALDEPQQTAPVQTVSPDCQKPRRNVTELLKRGTWDVIRDREIDATLAQQGVDRMLRSRADASCRDPGQDANVEAWLAARQRIIETERKCETDPACRGQKVLVELCPAIARHAEVSGYIKDNLKMARRTGALDVQEQHDLGEELGDLENTISAKKAEYKAAAKKSFTNAACKSLGADN